MTTTAPYETTRSSGPTWPDYVAAVAGSVAGGYLIGGLLVEWGAQGQPGLAFAVFGPILLVPLGSALGVTLALALSRRHSAVLTGILSLPITVAVWLVVYGLSMVIDTMGYGWLLVTPPFVAPMGARWIVLGRNDPPEPVLPAVQDWPKGRIVRFGALALLVGLLIWLSVGWLDTDNSDPAQLAQRGPRACECEELKEWFGSLRIFSDGDQFLASSIRVSESERGFILGGSQHPGDKTNPGYYLRSFRQAGFNSVQLMDEIDHWSATFFDSDTRRESPWIVDVTLLEDRIETTIRVRVDGSEWGIESTDQLWQLYVSDRKAALQAQRERQIEALGILGAVGQALGTINQG